MPKSWRIKRQILPGLTCLHHATVGVSDQIGLEIREAYLVGISVLRYGVLEMTIRRRSKLSNLLHV